MITVKHGPMIDVSWKLKDAIIGEDTDYQCNYFAGIAEPNYPMPATLSNADTATSYNDGFLLELLVTRIEHEL